MKTNSLVFEKHCDLDQQIPLKIQQIKNTSSEMKSMNNKGNQTNTKQMLKYQR